MIEREIRIQKNNRDRDKDRKNNRDREGWDGERAYQEPIAFFVIMFSFVITILDFKLMERCSVATHFALQSSPCIHLPLYLSFPWNNQPLNRTFQKPQLSIPRENR